jgi:uncharacterized protein YjdB
VRYPPNWNGNRLTVSPPSASRRLPSRHNEAFIRSAAALLAVGVSLTCDATTALAPARTERVTVTYTGETMVAVGRAVPLAVTVEHDGTPMAAPRLRVTSSDTNVLAISARGDSLVARRRGRATITAAVESALLAPGAAVATRDIQVTVGQLQVSPSSRAFTALGDTATLSATALDADGRALASVPVQWTSLDTLVTTVDAAGRLRARGPGTTDVRARIVEDGVETLASVRVDQQVKRFVFTPSAVLLDALAAETTLVVSGRDANDNAVVGAARTLSSCDPNVATISLIGVVRAQQNGVGCVVATNGSVTDTMRLEVNQRAVRLEISAPSGLAITSLGGELQLSARGFDRRNIDVADDRPNWYSLNPDIAQVDPTRGRVIGIAVGSAVIVAAMDTATAQAAVTVGNTLVKLDVTPDAATLASIDDSLRLLVAGRNDRGDLIPNLVLGWSTPDPSVVQLLDSGRVRAIGAGTARVIVTANGLADTSRITVTNAPASIDLLVPYDSLPFVGDTVTPPMDIRNSRGAPLAATSVNWSSDDPSVARVSTAGLVTAKGVGETFIRATSGVLGDSLRVIVENDPAVVVIDGTLDSLTALGQRIFYTAEARNASGAVLVGYPVQWRSTNTAVATVTTGGLVTATGYGGARIIASANAVADTVTLAVFNPTRLYVDNGIVSTPRVGTRARPYARIQDAVAAADANDTVVVRRGVGPYAETVALSRRITLLGDSTDFVAGGRDALRLPVVAHDSGSVGIGAITTAPITMRYLAIRHSLDGAAIETRGADVQLEYVYVNPAGDPFSSGRGISITNAPTLAILQNVGVRAVRGFGVRLADVSGGRITNGTITSVVTAPGSQGAGIEITGGSGNQVSTTIVRSAAGPQISLSATAGASLSGNDVAGEHQLIRVASVTGATIVEGTSFDLRRPSGEPFTGNSETDGRSGLEVSGSGLVLVRNNVFTDLGGSVSRMDAVRLINARGAPYGVRLDANRFGGGRYSVRSERSTWEMLGSRSDSAAIAVVASAGDTVTLAGDTLRRASGGCLSGSGAVLRLDGSLFDTCGTVTAPALTAMGATIDLIASEFRGVGGRAVSIAGAPRATARRNKLVAPTGAAVAGTGAGVLEADADTVEIVDNTVRGFSKLAGLYITGGEVRADSNRVSVNLQGFRMGSVMSFAGTENDVFDNIEAGVVNESVIVASLNGNWWGDGRGPRRSSVPAAVGDSIVGSATTSVLQPSAVFPGTATSSLRIVRGNGQVGANNVVLPKALSVRVVDVNALAVANVDVTFTVTVGNALFSNGTKTIVVKSNLSGLSEATLTPKAASQTITVRATAVGSSNNVTFTETVP